MASDATPALIPQSSPNVGGQAGTARKGALRQRFDAAKQVALDDAMGKADSWAKSVGNGTSGVKLDDIPRLVQVLGLKLVDARRICITPEERDEYEAYRVIARNKLSPQPKLEWDGDEG